jgi:single-stranded-DNA-specific exonuclease
MAAGVSLQKDNLASFRKGLGKAIEKQLGEIVLEEPILEIDTWLSLDEVNLELADAIEMLAPFGAGNPKLTLATRGVKLKSVTEIGKAKEHLRLAVEDENENVQNILWWSGAGEVLPEDRSKFDIAYSLRASSFRGEKQVTLQFEEFRVVEEKAIEIKEEKFEVFDLRLNSSFNIPDSALVWAEGADKAKGKSRYELHPADDLVIYSTPPSPADLRSVLNIVKPKTIHVLGIPPHQEKADEFLARLAGMAKYSINNKGGKVSTKELASVLAQRESVARIGLEWLAAGGHVAIVSEGESVMLSTGTGEANEYLRKELYVAVKGILEETAAYRAYFANADMNKLMAQGLPLKGRGW